MTNDERQSLLYATNPVAAKHHEWEINLNWGDLRVKPNGQISLISFNLDEGIPKKLSEIIDELLIQYAKCKINNLSLGQTLIERTLKQIE